MQAPTLPRIIQLVLAIGLLTGTGLYWRFNALGQNVINLTACLILILGLDNILIYYRCYKEKSTFEHEGTFIVFSLFMLGIIFESFNKSYGAGIWLNLLCKYLVITVLAINFSYYIAVLVILLIYFIRQIYRLMTETLLTANANLDRQNLNRFITENRSTYNEIHRQYPQVNTSCSICLQEFQQDSQCILLPSCQHCFHFECLTQWLNSKSTCPYCRHNIQLDLLLNQPDDS